MKFHTRAAFAAALCLGAMSSFAQTTEPSTGASPSTPPTHPSERSGPTTAPSTGSMNQGSSDAPMGDKSMGGSKAEAMQACKNHTGTQARDDCMKKAETDHHGRGADGSMRGEGSTTGGSTKPASPDSSSGSMK